MNTRKITIDLTKADRYGEQLKNYKDVLEEEYFKEHFINAKKHLDEIVEAEEEINNIIAFIGDRGAGKSSSMKSFIETESIKKKVYSLEIIDPSKIEKNSSLLEIIIGNMFKKFKEKLDESGNDVDYDEKRKLINLFQKVYSGINYITNGINTENEDIENLLKISESLNLKGNIEELIEKYLDFMFKNKDDKKALLIPVDDIDLNTEYAYKMIEQIRKYLICKNVVIILAVKLDQLKDIIKKNIYNEFLETRNYENKDDIKKEVEDRADKYLTKFIPLDRRFYLENPFDEKIGSVELHIKKRDETEEIVVWGENIQENITDKSIADLVVDYLKNKEHLQNSKIELIVIGPNGEEERVTLQRENQGLSKEIKDFEECLEEKIKDKFKGKELRVLIENEDGKQEIKLNGKNQLKTQWKKTKKTLYDYLEEKMGIKFPLVWEEEDDKKKKEREKERQGKLFLPNNLRELVFTIINLELIDSNVKKEERIEFFESFLYEKWIGTNLDSEKQDILKKFKNKSLEEKNKFLYLAINKLIAIDKEDYINYKLIDKKIYEPEENFSMGDIRDQLEKIRYISEYEKFVLAVELIYNINLSRTNEIIGDRALKYQDDIIGDNLTLENLICLENIKDLNTTYERLKNTISNSSIKLENLEELYKAIENYMDFIVIDESLKKNYYNEKGQLESKQQSQAEEIEISSDGKKTIEDILGKYINNLEKITELLDKLKSKIIIKDRKTKKKIRIEDYIEKLKKKNYLLEFDYIDKYSIEYFESKDYQKKDSFLKIDTINYLKIKEEKEEKIEVDKNFFKWIFFEVIDSYWKRKKDNTERTTVESIFFNYQKTIAEKIISNMEDKRLDKAILYNLTPWEFISKINNNEKIQEHLLVGNYNQLRDKLKELIEEKKDFEKIKLQMLVNEKKGSEIIELKEKGPIDKKIKNIVEENYFGIVGEFYIKNLFSDARIILENQFKEEILGLFKGKETIKSTELENYFNKLKERSLTEKFLMEMIKDLEDSNIKEKLTNYIEKFRGELEKYIKEITSRNEISKRDMKNKLEEISVCKKETDKIIGYIGKDIKISTLFFICNRDMENAFSNEDLEILKEIGKYYSSGNN